MIYVATPYSAPPLMKPEAAAALLEERWLEARRFVTWVVVTRGPAPFSPIVYMHPIATDNNLPGDADYWHGFNMQFLRKAEALFVLMLDGWERSKGVKAEIAIATELRMPIMYYRWEPEERMYKQVTIQ